MAEKWKAVHQTVREVSSEAMELPPNELDAFIVYDNLLDESVSGTRLICLTCGLGGLQVVWSVILSNGSPYLVSLGLSKSLTALVWIAAPLCGSFVQPIVGSWSDQFTSRWGRRRPFIVAGAIGIAFSMLLLAWSKELVRCIDLPEQYGSNDMMVISFATFWIYALNIAIQPVQAGIRSLMVESLSVGQQARASNYASVMQGLGNILGYFFGFWILPSINTTKTTLFQRLSIFASVILCVSVGATCYAISEKRSDSALSAHPANSIRMLASLRQTYLELPSKIRNVCCVQFFSWMGWFPFLYYSTTYVGEFFDGKLQQQHRQSDDIPRSERAVRMLSPDAIRYGTFASFLFAIVTFVYNVVLPKVLGHLPRRQMLAEGDKSHVSVVQAWKYSHVYFALLMFSTSLVQSEAAATAVVTFAGLSWALTLFAPFAIISTELAAQHDLERHELSNLDDLGLAGKSHIGGVFGLHNMAISLPQILAALLCSAIYTAARSFDWVDGTGWVLRAGGVSALGAAWLCRRLND